MRSRVLIVAGTLSASIVCGGWFLEHGLRGGVVWPPRVGGALGGPGAVLFDQVAEHVRRDFVDSMSEDSLYRASVNGMLYELGDPHTTYLPTDRYNRLTETTNGSYVGLGVQIDIRDGWITILAPVPGSPAERAGLQTGDRLIEVDGQNTQGWTQDEATKALRGAPNSTVKLTVERPGVEAHIPITVTRRDIHVRAVPRASLVRPTVGYVHVTVFNDSTARELQHAVDSLRSRGARSLLVDLRNDPGGLLAQGVEVADLFLVAGDTAVSLRGRAPGATQLFVDHDAERWPGMPVVILVDRGTASAAEIVAGALQDHDRAVVVGTPTYGKGSAQSLFKVPGGALKLTTARWYTPSGRSISRPTVKPDDDGADDSDSTPPDTMHATFKTSGGRVVSGGGGIIPDVVIGDTSAAPAQVAFESALGSNLSAFRDALTSYGLSMEGTHALTSPNFEVTPAMRDELWRRLKARGVVLDRSVYDAATRYIDKQLANELTRYVFGTDGLFARAVTHDSTLVVATDLAAQASSPADLLRLAAARKSPTTK